MISLVLLNANAFIMEYLNISRDEDNVLLPGRQKLLECT